MKVYRLFLATFLISSCIQIPIGNTPNETYKNINTSSPNSPFETMESEGSDASWIHPPTGNIISYRSECPTQISGLQDHMKNLSSQFTNSKVIKNETLNYNSREALKYTFNGDLEGITTSFETVSFKKYGCFFILTHNGKADNISSTSSDFNTFVDSFMVNK